MGSTGSERIAIGAGSGATLAGRIGSRNAAGGGHTIGTRGGMSATDAAPFPGLGIGTRSPARAAPITPHANATTIHRQLVASRGDGVRGCGTAIAPSVFSRISR
jgi:hypothetical protein